MKPNVALANQYASRLASRLFRRYTYNHCIYVAHKQAHSSYLHHPIYAFRDDLIESAKLIHAMTDAMSISSIASSGKRKRSAPKFYAVRLGRKPGIYHSWEDCKAQTMGMKAEFKSFPTLTEAEAFMSGSSSSASKPSKGPKFYGVAIGHVPGVYTDYASVQAQTANCPGAKQQAFATHEEAQAFVSEFGRDASAPISLRGDLSEASSLTIGKGPKANDNPSKKQKKNDAAPVLTNGDTKWEPGMGPLPPGAVDGFDQTIKLDPDTGSIRAKTEEELSVTKLQPTGDFSGPIHVYTDGSSLGNGRAGAVGGVGVYFGLNDTRNISEPLRGPRQTNQRAELTAVARALDHVPIDRAVLIHTDSNYSIKCLTEWFFKWEQNNWRSSSGKTVENRDLIEPILARIREREMCRAKTNFKWVKGHANDPGNVAADLLAVQGSRYSTPEIRDTDFRTDSATLNMLTSNSYENGDKHSAKELSMTATHNNSTEQTNEHSKNTTLDGPPHRDGNKVAMVDDDATDYEKIFAEFDEADGAGSMNVTGASVSDRNNGQPPPLDTEAVHANDDGQQMVEKT